MARTSRRLVAVATLMLALGAFAPSTAPTTQAAVEEQYEWTKYYYADATYTTLVGYEHKSCTGANDYSWGTMTEYYKWGYGPCGIDPLGH